MKILMTQYWPYYYQWLFVLLTMVLMSASLSSSLSPLLPSAKTDVIMTCAIKYNYYRYDYYISFDLFNKVSLNTSQWEFGIESCYPNMNNVFCMKNWVVEKRYNVCNRVNISNSILCVLRRIDPEDLVQNSYRYRFYAKYNSTYYLNKTIVQLKSINCECKDFYFDPNLNISIFPLLGKAEVNIRPFFEPTFDILDVDMTITPNEPVVIKKDNSNFQYQLSELDQCQNYSLDIALEFTDTTFKRKCKNNWKMNTGIIEFQIPELDVNEISCSHNLTHINLTSTSPFDSDFYYKLTIKDLQFIRNFTNDMSFSFPKMGNIISDNQIGFITLCYKNCEKCSITHPVTCYSNIPRDVARVNDPNKKSGSISVELIWSMIAVVVFGIVLGAAVMWRRYCCRKREGMISNLESIAPRPSDSTSNLPLNHLPKNECVEPVYEQIKECHIYDKCDAKLDHSSTVSGVSDRKENNGELLHEEDTYCEEMSSFLRYT